jgi:REP element-mobilizing transposase RayT
MSNPRRIVPHTTYFITRRTTRRHFLLNPDAKGVVEAVYWYVTAVLAAELGIQLHAVQVLSNHMHEVLTDTRGELPRFLQQRNRLFANALKVLRGWPEEVFARGGASCVPLYGEEAILRQIGYTLANAVAAGLATSPQDWPGVTLAARDIGSRTIRAERPRVYFDPRNSRWPAFVEIAISVPRALEASFGHESARERIRVAVSAAVRSARALAAVAGQGVRSLARIFATPHTRRASSSESARGHNPAFAAAGNAEMRARAQQERRGFLDAYRAALRAVRAGVADVLFPLGTWRFHRELGFAVARHTRS